MADVKQVSDHVDISIFFGHVGSGFHGEGIRAVNKGGAVVESFLMNINIKIIIYCLLFMT